MSRPGAWTRVFINLGKYLRKDWSQKHYVGEDFAGNRFYEISNTRQNVSRGFEPPTSGSKMEPGIEWQAWLRGTRRFPPSNQEIAINQARQQAQLSDNQATEKRAPSVQSKGRGAGDTGKSYPSYDDFEVTPGHKTKQ